MNRCLNYLLLLTILLLSTFCNKPERETSSLLVKHIDVVHHRARKLISLLSGKAKKRYLPKAVR